MGLRFRKSIKLAPGVRLNISKNGFSGTFGPRGASVGIGKRGAHLNTGIPSTGLYSRQRIGKGTSKKKQKQTMNLSVNVSVDDEGNITYLDENDNPASESVIRSLKKQKGDVIRNMIEKKCNEINEQIEALGEIHLYTPEPQNKPTFIPIAYDEPPPNKPKEKGLGILGKIFKKVRKSIESKNVQMKQSFEHELKNWFKRKAEFMSDQDQRRKMIEEGIYENTDLMFKYLEENLQDIVWPRETMISIDILDRGNKIYLDVDLPEIEDLPRKKASSPKRGYTLNVKEMSELQCRKMYMQHIHGIGFRIVGEAFSALPNASEIILSAYSQRPDKNTGHTTDEYLYSVIITRPEWKKINFKNLEALELVDAMGAFNIKRNMTKTGIFKPIEPFGQK